jgi:hypothetical protein
MIVLGLLISTKSTPSPQEAQRRSDRLTRRKINDIGIQHFPLQASKIKSEEQKWNTIKKLHNLPIPTVVGQTIKIGSQAPCAPKALM